MLAGAEHQLRVDQHADHAQAFVELDEAHPAHVAGEVVDDIHSLDRVGSFVAQVQIRDDVLSLRMNLVPLGGWLDIDAADVLVSLGEQIADEMPADKPAAATDYDSITRG